ncbi:tyrosine-protein phosphatase [Nocardia sp. NPDC051750]|uniref:tyrosine-protein phosphatase n=1 Tax=Nocardia sp. NPDC051750 TaxID=3364325 RepID=UPI0037AE1C90
MTASDTPCIRSLPLHGAVNARDLGGLRTDDGRTVRRLRVIRSDSLHELRDDDISFLLDRCGLATVVDLRAADEIRVDGRGVLPDTVRAYRHVHVTGGSRLRLDLAQVTAEDTMFAHYLGYLEHSSAAIVEVLGLLAEPEDLPALVHCAAGKDRTGVVIALLLGVLGVRADEIVADYAASAVNADRLRDRAGRTRSVRDRGVDVTGLPAWVFAAEAATMHRFLEHMDTEFGGITEWATAAGLDATTRRQLAANLLETPGTE